MEASTRCVSDTDTKQEPMDVDQTRLGDQHELEDIKYVNTQDYLDIGETVISEQDRAMSEQDRARPGTPLKDIKTNIIVEADLQLETLENESEEHLMEVKQECEDDELGVKEESDPLAFNSNTRGYLHIGETVYGDRSKAPASTSTGSCTQSLSAPSARGVSVAAAGTLEVEVEAAPSSTIRRKRELEHSILLIEVGEWPRTPQASTSTAGSSSQLIEIGESSSSVPQPPKRKVSPSSKSASQKRKLSFDQAEAYVGAYFGSDAESDSDDEDVEFGFLQCSRQERVHNDMLDNAEIAAGWRDAGEMADDADVGAGLRDADADAEQRVSGDAAVSADPMDHPAAPELHASPESVPSTEVTYGPHTIADFVWESLPQPALPPTARKEKFLATSGPVSSGNFSTPYEAFVSIWDRSIMENIAVETNRYADQKLEDALRTGELGGFSRKLRFKETDADELYVFFALILATGIVVKADLTEYWSVNDDIFDTPNFSRYMTYTRFNDIAQMLHFVDNHADRRHLSKSEAKIAKIAPIVEHLNVKFQALYQLGQCIALDESLTQWKGNLSILVFIENKAAGQGVKTFDVCDSKSGYLWRFKVHAGPNDKETQWGYTTSLVLELLEGLEHKGYSVYMDNYYNSPLLARLLKSLGFDCVGTLRLNREHVPASLKDLVKQNLPAGSVHGATSGDVDVLVRKDKNVVSLISTYHGAASAERDGKVKPTLVHDYNVRMGGVDKKDQMLSSYPIERKRAAVWYKKFFRRLLNVSVLNAYILHKESPSLPDHPLITKHRLFRKTLVKQILAKHAVVRPVVTPLPTAPKLKFSAAMLRHLPREYPFSEKLKQRKRAKCAVCPKRSMIHCAGCNVALCLEECFGKYHS